VPEVPIITYHSIDVSGSSVSTSPTEFKTHLAYLQRSGYQSLALRHGVRLIESAAELPDKAVIITFDDGYRNNLTHALPLLKQFGFTATIFITTGFAGNKNSWPDQHRSIPPLPMMTWDEIGQIREAGIDIGAHTHTHPRLSEIDIEKAQFEMERSKLELEKNLQETIDLFSYPYGDYDVDVKRAANELFDAAIGNRPGRLRLNSDLFAIERINACGGLFRRLPIRLSAIDSFTGYLAVKRTVDFLR